MSRRADEAAGGTEGPALPETALVTVPGAPTAAPPVAALLVAVTVP